METDVTTRAYEDNTQAMGDSSMASPISDDGVYLPVPPGEEVTE